MERFETDGTIGSGRISDTGMRLQTCGLDTDTALVAMTVFGRTANPTDAAGFTVILSLVFIVQKNTDGAPIGAQSRGTRPTGLASRLYSLTEHTLDRRYGMSIHRMRLLVIGFALIFDGVVAEPTGEEFVATGGQQHGFALVMGTATVFTVCCCLFLF